ncbi:hypothetical protein [Galbibacter sp. BG1]
MKKEERPEEPRVSKDVRKEIRKQGYHVQYYNNPKHYTRSARFNIGYNKLENLGVVRHYIQKRFNINHREFEMILFLYPKLLFDTREYREYPKCFTYRNIKKPMERGLIEIFTNHKKRNKIYRLTKQAKHIVVQFYKYISGELPIPEDPQTNPLFKKDATPMDRKRAEWIKRMNAQLMMIPDRDPEDWSS